MMCVEEILNHAREPIALLSACGHVIHANTSAYEIFASDKGLTLTERSRLLVINNEARSSLIKSLSLMSGEKSPQHVSRHVVIHDKGPPLVLTLQAMSQELATVTNAAAILFISDPQCPTTRNISEPLRAVYQLTPMEIKVFTGLDEGHSLKEIAQRLHISYETVRGHMRSILAKTRVRRQSDLIRITRWLR